ncbi:hypothetical protein IW136_006216, partial [Coemansia sp. RSA 678]
MSANEFLDTLRNFDLEHLYPCLHGCGITSNEGLVQVDPAELREFGVTGRDDVRNLRLLIQKLRESVAAYPQYPSKMQMAMSYSGNVRGRHEMGGFGDSDEELYPHRDSGARQA